MTSPGDNKTAGTEPEDNAPASMYAKHEKVYPRQVHGIFASLRTLGVAVLLGLYYIMPWLTWDDRQAVLLDLPARKFYILGLTFWPQDFFYFALLLIIAAIALFFFTALAGRLWCGYACPQTVWTEVFLWIERKIEGNRSKQMKLDNAPWDARKVLIKTSKHTVWIIFAAFTGFTFVGYFTQIDILWNSLLDFTSGPWENFWIIFYSLATYGNAGWLREQVCIYMCPYARFQSAMFDEDTLVIAYDEERGDPRGSRKKNVDPKEKGLGDCIDCTLCVQVCPTGIDIRDGMQYQCIGCAACIDVCDNVMDQMGYEKGLVRYTTENAIHGKKVNIFRPRIILYATLLLLLTVAMIYSISQRIPLEMDIIRDRNALYRNVAGGLVENIYTIRLINMSDNRQSYRISVSGLDKMKLVTKLDTITIDSGDVTEFSAQIKIDPVQLKRSSNEIFFTVVTMSEKPITISESARFIGPVIK